jgi:hypothetical protein
MDRDITPLEGLLIMYLSMIGTIYAVAYAFGAWVVLMYLARWIG